MSRRLGSGVCFPTMCATGSIRRTDEIRQEQRFDPKDASIVTVGNGNAMPCL